MSMPPQELTLAILAGGQGRRLGGVAKGLLRLDGQTLLQRLMVGAPATAEVLLVTDDAAPYAVAQGFRVVGDVVPQRGAPGGAVSALLAATTPWVLLVTCDMPFVDAAGVAPLLSAVKAQPGLRGAHFAKHPFPAVVASEVGRALLPLLSDEPSVRRLWAVAKALELPLTRPEVVLSVNTAEEAKTLRIEVP